MRNMVLLGLAGGVGTLARYGLTGFVYRLARQTFPFGTLSVNLVGCLLLGVVMHLVRHHPAVGPETRTVIGVGLLGGFTTFSAFGYETLELLQGGSPLLAGANVTANVVLGTAAAWAGLLVGKLLF